MPALFVDTLIIFCYNFLPTLRNNEPCKVDKSMFECSMIGWDLFLHP